MISSDELEEIGQAIEQLDRRCEATDREVAIWKAQCELTKKSSAKAIARSQAVIQRLDRYA